jgi:hypothetical protein
MKTFEIETPDDWMNVDILLRCLTETCRNTKFTVRDLSSNIVRSSGPVNPGRNDREEEEILQAVARGWCHKKTENKIMDVWLAEAIAAEVLRVIRR